jgi:hypothetical protein
MVADFIPNMFHKMTIMNRHMYLLRQDTTVSQKVGVRIAQVNNTALMGKPARDKLYVRLADLDRNHHSNHQSHPTTMIRNKNCVLNAEFSSAWAAAIARRDYRARIDRNVKAPRRRNGRLRIVIMHETQTRENTLRTRTRKKKWRTKQTTSVRKDKNAFPYGVLLGVVVLQSMICMYRDGKKAPRLGRVLCPDLAA